MCCLREGGPSCGGCPSVEAGGWCSARPISDVPPGVGYQASDVGLARRLLVLRAPSARLQREWVMPR